MSELAPCAHCASVELVVQETPARVVCDNCGAEGPLATNDTELAVRLWNQRWGHLPMLCRLNMHDFRYVAEGQWERRCHRCKKAESRW